MSDELYLIIANYHMMESEKYQNFRKLLIFQHLENQEFVLFGYHIFTWTLTIFNVC